MTDEADMKLRTARTIKWNVIDRVSSQLLYAVSGIVLARLLSPNDFGLVGAVAIFQAFASLMVDSGFSYALLQRKTPSHLDYSTVLWFNIAMATIIYLTLWFAAPLIADCFQDDSRLIALSRVMFLSFIINAASIVQINRLMKQMNVRMVAVSNIVALALSAIVGIVLAVNGFGAWAIVWQTLTQSTVKTLILWLTSHWLPLWAFSWQSLREIFSVGSAMMTSSFISTLVQNINAFFIGNRVNLVSLGYYSQADKWSKMGVASISQVLTSSFLPVLSQFQDDKERFARATKKMNKFTSYLLFPVMGFLGVMAEPLFHVLFGEKWDASIALFQLLLLRGVFVVLTSLYNNYIIALGRAKIILWTVILRDGAIFLALLVTLPMLAWTRPDDITYGVKLMLIGQVVASLLAFVVMLKITSRLTWRTAWSYVQDSLPYLVETLLIMIPMLWINTLELNAWVTLVAQGTIGVGLYMLINWLLKSKIQQEALSYVTGRLRRK